MFQIIGAMAEFERSLIQERVRAALRNVKLKGKTLGRPPLTLDHGRIVRLQASGASIREGSAQLGVPASTVHRTLQQRT
jgi:DNA invertase Pin-like site-specific DNA recombinase